MRTDTAEAAALARLSAEELGRATGGIRSLHLAIAERAFRAPASRPARLLHDAIARTVYGALRGGAWTAGAAAETALSRRQVRALSETRTGAALIAIVDGLRGDVLEAEGDPLALPMAVRVHGRTVPAEPEAVRRAFPEATGRIAVFVHGLFGTEHQWESGGRPSYGERLRRDHGWTPVCVRYNTGRGIDANGRDLATLLEALLAAWPVDVESVALVGHSMGGLVARSACHQAGDVRWKRLLRHSVTLGTPHTGSPVEAAIHHAVRALDRLPETRVLGNFLNRRSAGIRDLRRGLDHPPAETAHHHYVAAGSDLLVRRTSAVPADAEHALHVPGVGHFALLNHDDVYAEIERWLAD